MRTGRSHIVFVASCTAVLLACSDDRSESDGEDREVTALPTEEQISNPRELVLSNDAGLRMLAAQGDDDVVYVALPAGAVPDGAKAHVRRVGDEVPTVIRVADGGFEPVAVRAVADDSIQVVVHSASGGVLFSTTKPVKPNRPPIVVRTWPPRKKSDMPVNAQLVAVFSEPLDRSSVNTSTVRLFRGRREVAGQVSVLAGDGTTIVFRPAAALSPQREYRLVVSPGVKDLDGEAMEAEVVLGFATGNAVLGTPSTLEMYHDSTYLFEGETHQLIARVFDGTGNLLVDAPVQWTTEIPGVTVSSTGLVTVTSLGQPRDGYIFARLGDLYANSFIGASPTPASIELVPPSATIGVGDTLVLETYLRTQSGTEFFAPLTILNSNPAAATITRRENDWTLSRDRTIRAVAPGTTAITVKAGAASAVAEITVTPPRAVGAVRVAPAHRELLPAETLTLRAWAFDANGVEVVGRPVTWSTSNASIVSIAQNGQIRAEAEGTATITATSDGVAGTATITVTTSAAPPEFVSIDAFFYRTCATTAQGDAYCWGLASRGDGDDATESKNRPALVVGGRDYVSMSPGEFTVCGRTTSDDALCWGGSTQSSTPVRFASGMRFSAISATAFYHACGLDVDGKAYCWGYNVQGEVGDGTTEGRLRPTAVVGGRIFRSISTGGTHTCGVTTGGDAYCWGQNGMGKLGNGTTADASSPVLVSGGLSFAQVSAGGLHTCGITTQGAAYCWGSNFQGQLGDGTDAHAATPTAVMGGLTFAAIEAGHAHTCALTSSGVAYCWGYNLYGQLGVEGAETCTGSNPCSRQPIAVQGNLTFTRIVGGGDRTCAITAANKAYCWGENFRGELGDGTFVGKSVPTPVVRP